MARGWIHRVKIRHLFTEQDDYQSVQDSMNAIADVLAKEPFFATFREKGKFRKLPQGDGIVNHLDYANKLLDILYDFCDDKRIWIE